MQEKEEKVMSDAVPEDKVIDSESQSNNDGCELHSSQDIEGNAPSKNDNSESFVEKFVNKSFYIVVISFILSMSVNLFVDKEPVFNKEKTINDLSILINNDADLRAMKFYYNNKNIERRGFVSFFKNDSSSYIPASTPLSSVLEEIRTTYYLNGKDDGDFIEKLEGVIKEYGDSNPFDKLDSTQKDLFENIRVKLGDSYQMVSTDLNKLSDEIYSKNLLVSEYLSDSKTSLFVSIASAFIAVILAGIQMYQGRASKLARAISRALDINRNRMGSFNESVSYGADDEKIVTRRRADGKIIQVTYSNDGRVSRKLVR
ncbi:TPA: hypothetical protein ACGF6J_003676 [Vibrio cholerae]